ncbi:MAG: SBBP repeat-containing protein, partial [Lewinella sp.]|nr:SBBP repeat-containing protein [Lewinella sp.]
ETRSTGNYDAFLVKFDSDGVRQWGTYYGGSGLSDYGYGTATDANGNVFIAGQTNSDDGIATAGAHQESRAGTGSDSDAYLVKFNSAGVRQWGTYYGGSAYDRAWSVTTDAAGNVFLAGETSSDDGIAYAGHQMTKGSSGTGRDAFLAKFNAAGVRQWGTYYGGSASDYGQSTRTDGSGNVYLAGYTSSDDGIADGGHQNTRGGSTDAFLVKFAPGGGRLWGTYYGGSSAERGYSAATDGDDNVFLAGYTQSQDGIAYLGFQMTKAGSSSGKDAFLVKFASTGTRQWGTYYGGAGSEEGSSTATDADGNVYLAGETNSDDGIFFDGYQETKGASYDAFLVKFAPAGARQWGTYYGGEKSDYGLCTTTDPDGNVYLAGDTKSAEGIAYEGHQMEKAGSTSYDDAFLAKFEGGSACILPPPPVVDVDPVEFCEDALIEERTLILPPNVITDGQLVVWVLQSAPEGSGLEPGTEYQANCEMPYTNNVPPFILMANLRGIRIFANVEPGDYIFKIKILDCETECMSELSEQTFRFTKFANPADPVPDVTDKTFCYADEDVTPGLAGTGVSVENTLGQGERVVWVLTAKPDQSDYTVGDEFTTLDCDNAFIDFGELAVGSMSQVIYVTSNAPVNAANEPILGTYVFDAYVYNCETGCTSDLVGAFSITVEDDDKPSYGQGTPDVTLFTSEGADCPNVDPIFYILVEGVKVPLVQNRNQPIAVGNATLTYYVAGIPFETPNANAFDNCTPDEALRLYLWNVELDYDGQADDYYQQIRVVFRLYDLAGNWARREIFYTVIDDTPPVIECIETYTLNFNGEDYFLMADFLETFVLEAYDECGGDDITLWTEPYYISCEQLGEVVDVTITVCDGADPANCTTCTVAVTVDGLPCGWMTWDDHINCPGSSADYDVPSETFYLTSADCSHMPYSPVEEEYAYVKTVLCGDGEIIAQVTGMDGLGKAWAGITMRESNDPGSKKFQLMTGLDYLQHRVDWRTSTNGYNQSQSYSRYGQHWLRIVRTGPIFQAYTSFNGLTWGIPVNTQVIPMNECLEVGLIVTNVPYATNVTAAFNHVQVTPPYVPGYPDVVRPETEETGTTQALSLELFPNPTTGQLTLNLSAFREQDATLEVVDVNGQLILQRQLGVIENSTEQLDLSAYAAGMYFVRLSTSNGHTVVQRVILQPRP